MYGEDDLCNEPIEEEDRFVDCWRDTEEFDEDIDDREHFYHDDEDYLIDGVGFAEPGGNSSLRAETPSNPRNLPCPTCGAPNRLTPLDRAAGYQCDSCADAAEGGYGY